MIFAYLEAFERFKRQEINATNLADARGWAGLYNGFSGKNSKPVEPADLLPFGDEMRAKKRVSDRTMAVMARLIARRQLPRRVLATIGQLEGMGQLIEWEEEEE